MTDKYIEVPALAVVTTPYTHIIFDEDDSYEVTTEEMNFDTYDYLKLSRTTMSLHSGIKVIEDINTGVILSYNGTFLYPAVEGLTTADVIQGANDTLLSVVR